MFTLRALPLLLLLLAVAGATGLERSLEDDAQTTQLEQAEAHQKTACAQVEAAATGLADHMQQIAGFAGGLSQALSSGSSPPGDLIEALPTQLEQAPRLFSLTVSFRPGALEEHPGLFSPLWVSNGEGGWRRGQLEDSYDYTRYTSESAWYHRALLDGEGWSEPQYGSASARMLSVYSAPFCLPDDTQCGAEGPSGVVSVGMSLDDLSRDVAQISDTGSGYGFVFSRSGRYAVHPRDDFVRKGVSVFEDAWDQGNRHLHQLAIRAQDTEQRPCAAIAQADPLLGSPAWLFSETIGETGWTLGMVVPQADPLTDTQERRLGIQLLLFRALAGVVCFGLGLGGVLRIDRGQAYWLGSVLVTVASVFIIGGVWKLADELPQPLPYDSHEVVNAAALDRFEQDYRSESLRQNIEPPEFVSTGVFVQSINFASGSEVRVTGLIWQQHPADFRWPDGMEEGDPLFVLPEADDPNITLAYQRLQGDRMVIGWRYSANLRQDFDYSHYPIDRQEVWLRVLPLDFDRNVVLVPDLEAYALTAPAAKPGVESRLVLPGWTITRSMFNYRWHGYNTDFGIHNYVGESRFPELHYSVHLKRNLLDPFVSKIIPLSVVAVMLFSLLLLGSQEERKQALFGFTALEVVMGAAALFFVVIFEHAALRERLGSPEVMYMESFYFAMYLGLLFVSINAILFTMPNRFDWVHWRDNLGPKLLFAPLYMAAMAAHTLKVFY